MSFMPLFARFKEDRYYIAFCSPTQKLASDQLNKIKPFIDLGVEYFNLCFPDTPLLTKKEDRTLTDNVDKMEINRRTANGDIKYSSLDMLILGNTVVNAGYTIHMLFVDKLCPL